MRPSYAGIGSRETPSDICALMVDLADRLDTDGYMLRTGGADGADYAFFLGASVCELYLPYATYKGLISQIVPTPGAYAIAEQFHPRWKACSDHAKALHARNSHIILGRRLDDPVERIICWTRDGKASGGTGQGIRIARAHKIPVHNLYFGATVSFAKDFLRGKYPIEDMPRAA